jgi:hypothetical protein
MRGKDDLNCDFREAACDSAREEPARMQASGLIAQREHLRTCW